MVKCKACAYYVKPEATPKVENLPQELDPQPIDDDGEPVIAGGHCRRFPPSVLNEPRFAVFGPLTSSPLATDGPLVWKIASAGFSTFPNVMSNWWCGEAKS